MEYKLNVFEHIYKFFVATGDSTLMKLLNLADKMNFANHRRLQPFFDEAMDEIVQNRDINKFEQKFSSVCEKPINMKIAKYIVVVFWGLDN